MADPEATEAESNDLFGRWLAHHEQQSVGQGETPRADDITEDSSPSPRRSRRLPAAAVASSAVESDPMIGSRLAPPSSFGTRRPSANAPLRKDAVNELDREPPPGWEPIVMRSVRKRAEEAEAKQTPKPAERAGRLARLKARLVDPLEPEPEADPEPRAEDVPQGPLARLLAPHAAPAVSPPPLPKRSPAPPARSLEETIRAAVAPAELPVARHAVPVPEPVTAPPLVRAFVDVAPHVEPEPVAYVDPEPEPVAYVDPDPQPVAYVEPDPQPVAYVEPDRQPVAYVEPDPQPLAYVEPDPQPVAYVAPQPEPFAYLPPKRVAHVEPEPAPVAHVAPQPQRIAYVPPKRVAHVEPEPEPVVADDQPAAPRRSRFALPGRSPKEPKEPKPVKEPTPPRVHQERRHGGRRAQTADAARDLVAAKARARAAYAPAPRAATPPPVPMLPEPEPEPVVVEAPEVSKHDRTATEMPGVYKFKPKRTSRRMLTLALVAGLAASAYFVREATQVNDTPSIGLAAIVVLATATVWAIRAGASVTSLEVHQGQLVVVQQGHRFVFDLASQYTLVEVQGKPGRRGWKVLFPRRSLSPFVLDATMVDPDDFMRVLRFFRPQLVTV